MHVSVGILDFLHLRWIKNINLVEPLVSVTRTWILFCHFKVSRLHSRLFDAAGAVKLQSGKDSGYRYMIGRGPFSSLLDHVTGLLFCLYVKHFLPSFFNSVDFWSSMSCIVLDIETEVLNGVKELGGFSDGKVQGYSFRPVKKYKPTKQEFWCTRNLHASVWNTGCLDHS